MLPVQLAIRGASVVEKDLHNFVLTFVGCLHEFYFAPNGNNRTKGACLGELKWRGLALDTAVKDGEAILYPSTTIFSPELLWMWTKYDLWSQG